MMGGADWAAHRAMRPGSRKNFWIKCATPLGIWEWGLWSGYAGNEERVNSEVGEAGRSALNLTKSEVWQSAFLTDADHNSEASSSPRWGHRSTWCSRRSP